MPTLPDVDLQRYLATYRDGLLHDTLPFWLPRAIDQEHGGYLTALGEDGAVLQTDKAVWFQGRFAWLLATLCNTVEHRPEWLAYAKHGIDFIQRHCFDTDGRMFFLVTREGKPLRKRRYCFSEIFAINALAAYSQAAGDKHALRLALDLFERVSKFQTEPKTDPGTRPMKSLVMPMLMIVTAQELRKVAGPSLANKLIDDCIAEIERDFLKPEFKCLLETVGPGGEFIDTFDGRMLNPGHAIEAGWFILEEARYRNNNPRLIELGTTIIDWMMDWGWDREHGGLLYYRDVKGLPCTEYWHDMKFWWPHNEAIIGTLLAHLLTGEPRFARWHKMVHDWAYAHFPDPLHGEWFGYLHRDGTVSTRLKGNVWKGPYHHPRMQWYCWQRLEEELKRRKTPP